MKSISLNIFVLVLSCMGSWATADWPVPSETDKPWCIASIEEPYNRFCKEADADDKLTAMNELAKNPKSSFESYRKVDLKDGCFVLCAKLKTPLIPNGYYFSSNGKKQIVPLVKEFGFNQDVNGEWCPYEAEVDWKKVDTKAACKDKKAGDRCDLPATMGVRKLCIHGLCMGPDTSCLFPG